MTVTHSECVFVALACKAHTSYYTYISHMFRVWIYHVFAHYPINGTIFGKKLLDIKLHILVLSSTLSQTFLILIKN